MSIRRFGRACGMSLFLNASYGGPIGSSGRGYVPIAISKTVTENGGSATTTIIDPVAALGPEFENRDSRSAPAIGSEKYIRVMDEHRTIVMGWRMKNVEVLALVDHRDESDEYEEYDDGDTFSGEDDDGGGRGAGAGAGAGSGGTYKDDMYSDDDERWSSDGSFWADEESDDDGDDDDDDAGSMGAPEDDEDGRGKRRATNGLKRPPKRVVVALYNYIVMAIRLMRAVKLYGDRTENKRKSAGEPSGAKDADPVGSAATGGLTITNVPIAMAGQKECIALALRWGESDADGPPGDGVWVTQIPFAWDDPFTAPSTVIASDTWSNQIVLALGTFASTMVMLSMRKPEGLKRTEFNACFDAFYSPSGSSTKVGDTEGLVSLEVVCTRLVPKVSTLFRRANAAAAALLVAKDLVGPYQQPQNMSPQAIDALLSFVNGIRIFCFFKAMMLKPITVAKISRDLSSQLDGVMAELGGSPIPLRIVMSALVPLTKTTTAVSESPAVHGKIVYWNTAANSVYVILQNAASKLAEGSNTHAALVDSMDRTRFFITVTALAGFVSDPRSTVSSEDGLRVTYAIMKDVVSRKDNDPEADDFIRPCLEAIWEIIKQNGMAEVTSVTRATLDSPSESIKEHVARIKKPNPPADDDTVLASFVKMASATKPTFENLVMDRL